MVNVQHTTVEIKQDMKHVAYNSQQIFKSFIRSGLSQFAAVN